MDFFCACEKKIRCKEFVGEAENLIIVREVEEIKFGNCCEVFGDTCLDILCKDCGCKIGYYFSDKSITNIGFYLKFGLIGGLNKMNFIESNFLKEVYENNERILCCIMSIEDIFAKTEINFKKIL